MSFLNLSRISTLKGLHRLSVAIIKPTFPQLSRTLVSTRPFLNTKQEWPKVGEELESKIREASRLEQKTNGKGPNRVWRYILYVLIAFSLISITLDFYARSKIANMLAFVEEMRNYVASLNEEIHQLLETELTSNQRVKELLGSPVNLGKEFKVGIIGSGRESPSSSKLAHQHFDSTSDVNTPSWNRAEPIKETPKFLFTLSFPVSGTKNSGIAYAFLKIDLKTKETRLSRITLSLESASDDNVAEIAFKTDDILIQSKSK